MRKAVETQISHFGQTPTQLFDTPHPKRMDRDEALKFHYPLACERAALVSKTCVRREDVASFATHCSGIHFDTTTSTFCICVKGNIVLRFRYEPDSFPAKLVRLNSKSHVEMRGCSTLCWSAKREKFWSFHIFMFELGQKNITHIADSYRKKITRKKSTRSNTNSITTKT